MLVLGIESTCDETGCAIVKDGKEILSNIVASQIDLQKEFGGVVPELACRKHIDAFIPVLDEALKAANVSLHDIDLIAASNSPGLIGALLIGLNAAKTLSLTLNKPFIGVNHIEAHLYAAIMNSAQEVEFPCLGVVLSGGHTALLRIEKLGSYQLISETVDDAIGEAFDKVARLLGYPYPGGPQIEKLALMGDNKAHPYKAGTVKGHPLHFSFSGLKTAVLYSIKGKNPKVNDTDTLSHQQICDTAASFQYAAFKDIINKINLASVQHSCSTVILGGGVTNNNYFRKQLSLEAPHLRTLWPEKELTLDNAAMIAGLGYHMYLKKGQGDSLELEAFSRNSNW